MSNPDLQRWLNTSIRGLDPELASDLRDELQHHYEDAVADYLADGYSAFEAHTMTMRDLGDESAVHNGFHSVYRNHWRYWAYAIVGLVYPVAYILSIPFNESIVGGVAFNLAIFLPMIYIISSLRFIVREHFHTIDIDKNVMLIRWGVIVLCITRLIGWRIYHHPTILESYSRSIFDAVSLWEMGLNFASIAGLLLAAGGFIFIGEQMLNLHDDLFGLVKPLGVAIVIGGVSFAIYGIGSLLGMADVCVVAEMIAVVSGMIATLAWSYVFWCERQRHLQVA